MASVLDIEDVSVMFGNITALTGATLSIEKGQIYGLVGKNGSGKTTLMRAVCGLVHYTGRIRLFGTDRTEGTAKRGRVGALLETPAVSRNLSGPDNIREKCILLGVDPEPAIPRLLRFVGLDGVSAKKKAKDYSLGMRQRLGIAKELVGDPQLLVLDEPINGLDPDAIVMVRDLLTSLAHERGVTVFVSSHILGELSRLADRFGIIERGRIVKEITARELQDAAHSVFVFRTPDADKAAGLLAGRLPLHWQRSGTEFTVTGAASLSELMKILIAGGIEVSDVAEKKANIEDVYMDVLKEEAGK